jgi:hypothetical protein
MEWFVIVVLIGLIPAAIAKNKGRSFGAWWLYGSLLFIIALPHALIMGPDRESLERRRVSEEGLRKCPYCAELVKSEATICRYCQRELPPVEPVTVTEQHPIGCSCEDCRRAEQERRASNRLVWVLILSIPAAVVLLGLIVLVARR